MILQEDNSYTRGPRVQRFPADFPVLDTRFRIPLSVISILLSAAALVRFAVTAQLPTFSNLESRLCKKPLPCHFHRFSSRSNLIPPNWRSVWRAFHPCFPFSRGFILSILHCPSFIHISHPRDNYESRGYLPRPHTTVLRPVRPIQPSSSSTAAPSKSTLTAAR